MLQRKTAMNKPKWWPRRRRLQTRVELNDAARAFLQASIRAEKSRRARLYVALGSVIVVLAAAALTATGFYAQANHQKHKAQVAARQAIALALVADASDILSRKKSGGDVQAFQELLAANALGRGDAVEGGLLDAIVSRQSTAQVADIGQQVQSVAFSPDGRRVANSAGSTVQLRSADTGQIIDTLTGDPGFIVLEIAFSSDGHRLAAGDNGGNLFEWDVNAQPVAELLHFNAGRPVNAMAFGSDGVRIATAGFEDGTVRTWNADTGQKLSDTTIKGGSAFSPDLRHLATTNGEASQLWDVQTAQPLGGSLPGGTVVFSSDGHRLAVEGNRKVLVQDADTGQQVGIVNLPPRGEVYIALNANGDRMAASNDDTVQVWDSHTGEPVGDPLIGHSSSVEHMAFSPDGHRLVTGSQSDNTVRLWNLDKGQPLNAEGNYAVAFSPDGRRLATGGYDRGDSVRLWDTNTGQPVGAPLTGHTSSMVTNVAFSPNGERLISFGYSLQAPGYSSQSPPTVFMWNPDTHTLISSHPVGRPSREFHAAISPDGHSIAIANDASEVAVWDVDKGKLISAWNATPADNREPSRVAPLLAFSPDGRRLATNDYLDNSVVRFWDPTTGQPSGPPLTLATHDIDVRAMAFSPHRPYLAVSTDNYPGFPRYTVQLWNLDTSTQAVKPLTGFSNLVESVAFSPDGHRLATGSANEQGNEGGVRVWDADSGQPIGQPFQGHQNYGITVAFSTDPGGSRLASASGDNTARIWPSVGDAEVLCAKLTVNISPTQWKLWVSSDPQFPYRQLCDHLPPAHD